MSYHWFAEKVDRLTTGLKSMCCHSLHKCTNWVVFVEARL